MDCLFFFFKQKTAYEIRLSLVGSGARDLGLRFKCSPVVGVTRGGTLELISPACYSDYGGTVGMFPRVLLRLRGNS
mgnify:CR=1 FL=1